MHVARLAAMVFVLIALVDVVRKANYPAALS